MTLFSMRSIRSLGVFAVLAACCAWAWSADPAAAPSAACKGWLACDPTGAAPAAPKPVQAPVNPPACKGWLACGEPSPAPASTPEAAGAPVAGDSAMPAAEPASADGTAIPSVAALPEPVPEQAQKPKEPPRSRPVSAPLVSPYGQASFRNPAAPAAVLQQGRGGQFRMGLLSFGLGYEIGALNNIEDQIDTASDQLERFTITEAELSAQISSVSFPDVEDAKAALKDYVVNRVNTEVIDVVNPVLTSLGKEGHMTLFGNAQIPLTPFVVTVEALGGSVVLDANFQGQANAKVLASPLSALDPSDIQVDVISDGSGYQADADFDYEDAENNESSVLVRAALIKHYGLGYSHNVWKSDLAPESWESGWLTVGGRLKYYEVRLVRAAVRLKDNDDAEDTLKDAESQDSTGLGLDLGAQWTSRHYRAGAWVNNLNAPEFKFNKLDLSGYTDTKIKNGLRAGSTYTMKPQLQLEGALYTADQHWVLDMSLDANPVPDPLDRDFQWMALNAAYVTNTAWTPGLRVGYRENLAGTQLSYLTAGLTWFGVNLDLAYGLQSIKHDGDTYPRSFMLNLSSSITF
jgi:hypothetical protein